MSEHEFDIYLKLLAKMLRLSDNQRDAVADELRDHLETRLEELTSDGTPRNTAIQAALEEFGDAAGLANQLTRIAHTRTRRRIMRYSLTSAAATVLIALFVTAVLPDGQSANTAQQVTAQQGTEQQSSTQQNPFAPQSTAAEDSSSLAYGFSSAANNEQQQRNAAAQASLSTRLPLDLQDIPLAEVIHQLSAAADQDIIITSQNIDPGHPITLTLRDVSIATALGLILEQAGLAHNTSIDINDGIIMIADRDSNQDAEVRMYNVRDITASSNAPLASVRADAGMMGGSGGGGMMGSVVETHELQAIHLIETIEVTLNNDSWASSGGFGTVMHLDGILIISHSPQMHQRIESFLTQYRLAINSNDGQIISSR